MVGLHWFHDVLWPLGVLMQAHFSSSSAACVSLGWWLLPAGQLQQLMSLPWAGVLQLKRDKLLEPVPVVEVGITTDQRAEFALQSQSGGQEVEKLHCRCCLPAALLVGASVTLSQQGSQLVVKPCMRTTRTADHTVLARSPQSYGELAFFTQHRLGAAQC